MSTGPRIPLDLANRAAGYLLEVWQMPDLMVVGSVRRHCATVGDIEFVAPAWDGSGIDSVYAAIAATMDPDTLPAPAVAKSIFEKAPEPIAPKGKPLGRAIKGLKPGFLACALEIRRRDGSILPVQIWRYHPDNKGWTIIRTTGPADFGKVFLSIWKDRFGIAHNGNDGGGAPASVDGFLVDASRVRVSTPTEESAFLKCGMNWKEPWERSQFAERWINHKRVESGELPRGVR